MSEEQIKLIHETIQKTGMNVFSIRKKSDDTTIVEFPSSADTLHIQKGTRKFYTRIVSNGITSPALNNIKVEIERVLS